MAGDLKRDLRFENLGAVGTDEEKTKNINPVSFAFQSS